ncbi:hypothetical protein DICVIV_00434 [Dictyocaulus viviparus]|uniref:Uncharacterized protein n=1 Tax=Dictyocaulus viviparus TaxID=29172 RepID=A0A0D8YF93_DICVI|nr:hypothetical protein DICVIV_00434 [Dictyocaulus viviparus]
MYPSRRRITSQWPRGLAVASRSHSTTTKNMDNEGSYVASTIELTRKQVWNVLK